MYRGSIGDISFAEVVFYLGIGALLGALFGIILAIKTKDKHIWVVVAIGITIGTILIMLSRMPAIVG